MAQTGIIWGAWNKRLRIGLNVRWDDIGPGTTSSHVWVDWYVSSQNAFQDRQYLNFTYSLGGRWEYTLSTPNGITDRFIGTYDIGVQGVGYGGSGAWNFGAYVSDAYEGSAPDIVYYFALPARPPSTPGYPGIGVDSVTSNSARIVVTAAPDNGAGIDAYQVIVGTNGTNVETIIASQVANFGGGTGYATNLTPSTGYAAIARARNAVGWGPWAGYAYFTTGATTPGQVTGVTATNVGVTNATLNWNVPGNGGSAITGYMQQFATDASFTQNLQQFEWSAGNSTVTTLLPGSTYYVRVRARNGVGWGPWSATGSFVTLPGTPVITNPPNAGNIVRTDGTLDVTFTLQGAKSDTTVTIQYSQDSTFASGVREITALVSGNLVSGNTYRFRNLTLTHYQKTGQWYVRARATTPSSGYTSPWTNANAYQQSHQPSATLVSPTTGATLKYESSTAFRFRFIDAAFPPAGIDKISAYQLQIVNNDTGESVYDSGKLALSQTSDTVTISRAIASSLKNVNLRWRVRVWDYGDTDSAWTGYSTLRLTDPPVVAITSPPTALPVDNGSPVISWTFNAPSGSSQASATVKITDAATGVEVWSTTVTGAITSVQPDRVVLLNEKSYNISITARDGVDLQTTVSSGFSTQYVSPDPVAYDFTSQNADQVGYARVFWTDANPDSQFSGWRVYRRLLGESEWHPIATVTDENQREYRDYMLNAGEVYQYSVTQLATRSGTELESAVGYIRTPDGSGGYTNTPENRSTIPDLMTYWIINADTPSSSVRLPGVTSDPSTLEFESATYNIIGRGRHRDYGDELGYTGTLTVQILGATRPNATRASVEELRRLQETYYLRTPFGRIFQVALGNLGWDPRAGVGTNEMGTMTIPYEEVS